MKFICKKKVLMTQDLFKTRLLWCISVSKGHAKIQ